MAQYSNDCVNLQTEFVKNVATMAYNHHCKANMYREKGELEGALINYLLSTSTDINTRILQQSPIRSQQNTMLRNMGFVQICTELALTVKFVRQRSTSSSMKVSPLLLSATVSLSVFRQGQPANSSSLLLRLTSRTTELRN